MSVDDEKLVDCLKTNPCLWDKNRQDFRSSALKDAKWKEIAAELDSTCEYLTTVMSPVFDPIFCFSYVA